MVIVPHSVGQHLLGSPDKGSRPPPRNEADAVNDPLASQSPILASRCKLRTDQVLTAVEPADNVRQAIVGVYLYRKSSSILSMHRAMGKGLFLFGLLALCGVNSAEGGMLRMAIDSSTLLAAEAGESGPSPPRNSPDDRRADRRQHRAILGLPLGMSGETVSIGAYNATPAIPSDKVRLSLGMSEVGQLRELRLAVRAVYLDEDGPVPRRG